MKADYQELIETLAAKLGTTVEHLWGVLVRQAPISGLVSLAFCLVLIGAVVGLVFLVKRKTTYNKGNPAEWEGDAEIVAWIIATMGGAVMFLVIATSAQKIAAALLNPEYWALMQLLGR